MLRTVPRAKQWITVESLPEGCYGQSAEDDGEPAPPGRTRPKRSVAMTGRRAGWGDSYKTMR